MSFTDLFNREHRWPTTTDRLLQPPARWEDGVRFSDDSFSRDVFIWDGYMTAGAALVKRAMENNFDRHQLVYPILFNYRHGLEVAIKWVLDRYGQYAAIDEYERDHRLDKLWRVCKQVIVEFSGDGPDEAVEVVEKIVMEFHHLDPNSFAFRYSKNKKGATVNLLGCPIDLENIRDVMEGVDHFFNGLDGQLSELSSAADYSY